MTLLTIGGKGTPGRTLFWLVSLLIFLSLVHTYELTSLASVVGHMSPPMEFLTQMQSILSQLSTASGTEVSDTLSTILTMLQEISTDVGKLLVNAAV